MVAALTTEASVFLAEPAGILWSDRWVLQDVEIINSAIAKTVVVRILIYKIRALAFVGSWLKQSVEFSKWIEKNTYRTIENLRLSAAPRHLRYSLQWLRVSPDYSRVTD
jgi:hypothetical protein